MYLVAVQMMEYMITQQCPIRTAGYRRQPAHSLYATATHEHLQLLVIPHPVLLRCPVAASNLEYHTTMLGV